MVLDHKHAVGSCALHLMLDVGVISVGRGTLGHTAVTSHAVDFGPVRASVSAGEGLSVVARASHGAAEPEVAVGVARELGVVHPSEVEGEPNLLHSRRVAVTAGARRASEGGGTTA